MEVSCCREILGEEYVLGHVKWKYGLFKKAYMEHEILLKIKIFMWFVHRKEILTKDNMIKRNWQGSKK
jgi:hypothetical protein